MKNFTNGSSNENSPNPERIWLSWHYHRRSDYLSREFGCTYYHFGTDCRNRLCRYVNGIYNTLKVLINKRPKIVFVQNPSILLAVMAVILKPFFNYSLINDLHTPFIELSDRMESLFWKIQHFVISHSDMTLVTNERFRKRLNGDRIMILPDALPELNIRDRMDLAREQNIMYVCTFSQDEPYQNVIQAADLIDDTGIYITGNHHKAGINKNEMPSNVYLTGYIPDEEYFKLMNSVDSVMVLTEQEGCLVCGAYEAISFSKPLVLSDTEALREYFSGGCFYVKHDPESIAEGIKRAIDQNEKLESEIRELKQVLKGNWNKDFDLILDKVIGTIK